MAIASTFGNARRAFAHSGDNFYTHTHRTGQRFAQAPANYSARASDRTPTAQSEARQHVARTRPALARAYAGIRADYRTALALDLATVNLTEK